MGISDSSHPTSLHFFAVTWVHIYSPVTRWDKVQPKALKSGAINELLKTLGNACQFDFVPDLSSHSFRRGLSTSAARERVDFELIKKQGGWKSDATVWEYIEEGQQLKNNASVVFTEKMATMMVEPKWHLSIIVLDSVLRYGVYYIYRQARLFGK